jgi:hypothetical protein
MPSSDSGGSRGPSLFTSTSVSYAFARAVASLTVDRGFSETFVEGQNFGVVDTQGASLGLTYPFTPNIGGSANAFYRKTETTRGLVVAGSTRTDEVNETWGVTAMVTFTVSSWLRLSVSYTHNERLEVTSPGYVENRGRAALDLSF